MSILAEIMRLSALVMLSCVVPLGIFIGRNNIRAFRREIVRDLERLFGFARLPDGQPLIIPSFELVKYKYDPESNPNRDVGDNPHSFRYYLLPVLIYIVLTALGFRMAVYAGCSSAAELFCISGRPSKRSRRRRSSGSGRAELQLHRQLCLDDPIFGPADFQFRPCADLVLSVGRPYAPCGIHNGGDMAESDPCEPRAACAGHHRISGRLLSDALRGRVDCEISVAAA